MGSNWLGHPTARCSRWQRGRAAFTLWTRPRGDGRRLEARRRIPRSGLVQRRRYRRRRIWQSDPRMERENRQGSAIHQRRPVSDLPDRLSPDGKTLAAAKGDGVELWDLASGRGLPPLTIDQTGVTAVAWAPDGKRLATASRDLALVIADFESRKILHRHAAAPGAPVELMEFSPDGRNLAVGAGGTWVLDPLDLATSAHSEILCLGRRAWSPDGSRIALAQPQRIHVRSEFREGFVAFDVPGSVHRNFAWSSDGNRLAVGPQNCEVYLCDVPSQKIVGLKGETSANHCMAWSPDGKLLATGSQNTVRIWNADGKLVRTLEGGHTDIVTAVAWSHDGRVLASGAQDRIVRLWDVESGKPLPFEKKVVGPPHAWQLLFSPDDKHLVTCGQHAPATVWDVKTGKALGECAGTQLHISPDSKRLTAVSWHFAEFCQLDLDLGQILARANGPAIWFGDSSVAWAANTDLAAGRSEDGRGRDVYLWQPSTGKPLGTLRFLGDRVLRISPEDTTTALRRWRTTWSTSSNWRTAAKGR